MALPKKVLHYFLCFFQLLSTWRIIHFAFQFVEIMIPDSDPVLQSLLASLFTWGVTALGAALVFVLPSNSKKVLGKLPHIRVKTLSCSRCKFGFRSRRNDSSLFLVITSTSNRDSRIQIRAMGFLSRCCRIRCRSRLRRTLWSLYPQVSPDLRFQLILIKL